MVSCTFHEKWDARIWKQGIFRILFCFLLTSYVDIIKEATISRVLSYPAVSVIFEKYILSSSNKLEDAEPTVTLDSWSGEKK